jgi:hypothetical protein
MEKENERPKPSEKKKLEELEARIAELEKAGKAAFVALRAIEEHCDEPFVKTGEYLGEKFAD